mmetsp:Transcript_32983/g.75447  ORF Transcript_32983/g.75447 Transcript_32983/m.75447 type:complete len:253 (-) Transcript_32983:621-1379(-)
MHGWRFDSGDWCLEWHRALLLSDLGLLCRHLARCERSHRVSAQEHPADMPHLVQRGLRENGHCAAVCGRGRNVGCLVWDAADVHRVCGRQVWRWLHRLHYLCCWQVQHWCCQLRVHKLRHGENLARWQHCGHRLCVRQGLRDLCLHTLRRRQVQGPDRTWHVRHVPKRRFKFPRSERCVSVWLPCWYNRHRYLLHSLRGRQVQERWWLCSLYPLSLWQIPSSYWYDLLRRLFQQRRERWQCRGFAVCFRMWV